MLTTFARWTAPFGYLPVYQNETTGSSTAPAHRIWVRRRRCLYPVLLLALVISLLLSSSANLRAWSRSGVARSRSWLSSVHQQVNCEDVHADVRAVECHVRRAQEHMQETLLRQSKTYKAAVRNYRKRYKRQPPPGFQDWFEFAVAHNATLIDDYDQLEMDLQPLRNIPAPLLRQRMQNALNFQAMNLHQWRFAPGKATLHDWSGNKVGEDSELFRSTMDILAPIMDKLPSLSILQNWDDKMRVCGPRDQQDNHSPSLSLVNTTGMPDNVGWLTHGCPRDSSTKSPLAIDRPSIDACEKVQEWMPLHGISHIPHHCFNTTIPMFSLGRVSSFQDLTRPSWWCASSNYRLFKPGDKDKIAYADKNDTLYWRGRTTGANNIDPYFRMAHRQRFVTLGQHMRIATEALKRGEEIRDTLRMPNLPLQFTAEQIDALSRLEPSNFDINFVELWCDDVETCRQWKSRIPSTAKAPLSNAFKNKFLFDLDGNSVSGRFYRFLDSNSLPFKQTIYVEWHDGRIVPWLHYVPISLEMDEVPLLLDYFLNDPDGILIGEFLANEGKRWAESSLRVVDLTIYFYRQLLELAHIIGQD
ncbi:hypothetical protein BCV70DRAFT_51156 [Testicularia cyperi]|uniref:Glycosyl transferase CAP10 domain-containing protein n=1 Tax=Testicularia cyperi TaxID=1882483 RepID=A0A317XWV6_9BASI|nr:hypothetical protein BCV70DRAFT_51156 [Testicularia cyperi]